ncbi:cache domain-containing sensor histidine kinase [Cohnella herbarum]|uniref:Sensor histidine kinase n=1 Tax=Cohnella herbarum TaxID=2728023 RepID=A0A7Z2VQL5_9BACL|nr:sensor histidine kinase [Cohnella herbarum]QJD87135.1 sensor histidine kinase [Cohnella herbarum]
MIQSVARFFNKWLYNIKLRDKILFTYLVLIIFPLGIYQFAASDKISTIIINQMKYSAEQGFDQTFSYLSYRIQRIAKTTDILVANPTVIEVMKPHNTDDINRQLEDYAQLKKLLQSMQDSLDISKMILYVPESFIFANELENFLPLGLTVGSPCYDRLFKEQDSYAWCTPNTLEREPLPNNDFISVVRSILNPNDYRNPIGQLRVDVRKDVLQGILTKANVVKNSVSYLSGPDNEVIVSSGSIEFPLIDQMPERQIIPATQTKIQNNVYYLYSAVPSSQWSMVTAIPLDEVMKQSNQLRNQLLLLLIGIAVAAYIVAYVLAISVTRRITKLTTQIREVQSGDLLVLTPIQGKDEIGELIRTYNYMIKKITAMNEQQYQLGKDIKGAELKALQSQINPHFLYNTLDLINWMASRRMNEEIRNVVKTLARFYKVSLSRGQDIITIAEELKHVSFYVQIQNIRYDNKIAFVIDVADDIQAYAIPKITLQPIVENAIHHGILGRESREGTIAITADRTADGITIVVEDNGIGMNEDSLRKAISGIRGNPAEDNLSYGTKNVDMRIRHYFGDGYGLTLHSVLGAGTRVEIHIPATEEQQ